MKRVATLVLALLLSQGCASWRHGNPVNVRTPWDSELRQPTSAGQMLGVDSRAKEIERNLGVR